MSYSQHFLLSNGLPIPAVGFGTWHIPEEAAEAAVRDAIQTGYRLVDTAAVYRNEAGTGRGILSSGVPREELFITSKLWNTERSYDKAMRAFDETMERLQLSYLDLYLIHWPANGREYEDWDAVNRETWRAMIDLYKSGRVRSIGVSNFRPHHLTSLLESEVPPMVNQIVNLIKNTSCLYIIGGADLISLTYSFVTGENTGGAYAPAYLVSGLLFFVICYPLSKTASVWEIHLKKRDQRVTFQRTEGTVTDNE